MSSKNIERRPHTRGIAIKVQKPKKKPVWYSESSASETELDDEKEAKKQKSSRSRKTGGKTLASDATPVRATIAKVTEQLGKNRAAMDRQLKVEELLSKATPFIKNGAMAFPDMDGDNLSDISDEALEELRQEAFDDSRTGRDEDDSDPDEDASVSASFPNLDRGPGSRTNKALQPKNRSLSHVGRCD